MKWADPTPNNPYVSPDWLVWNEIAKILWLWIFQLTGGILGFCHVEKILRSHLSNLGIKVELGTTLRSFTQHAGHVTVELDIGDGTSEQSNFDFVIGADGARGNSFHYAAAS